MEDVAARQPDRLLEVNRVLASSPQEQRSAVGAWQQRDGLVAGASIAKISSLAISRHPAEALGFVPPDETVRVAELRETPLELFCVDRELMDIFETQTQMLRLLDRRLGSAVQAAQISAHVQQIASVLHRCVGRDRPSVARGLTEAAALAGWQALDRADVTAAWEFHETAKAAALEGADAAVAAHVVAQQGLVLLDAEQPRVARESVQAAVTRAGGTPPIMRSWLAAAAAECHASLGDAQATRRCLEHAESLLAAEDGTEIPTSC